MSTAKRKDSTLKTSRRRFAKNVTAALLSAPLAASLAHAQTPPAKPKEAVAPPNPPPPQPTQPQPSPVAEAYAEVARARFGDKLTPEQMEQFMKDMGNNVRAAESLRSVKLKNEDEPDFVFSA
jgi:hypothetical protein